MKYGYARISTIDQNADMQMKALQRAGCKKIFKDELSGATTKRPALLRCLKMLQDGDTLIVEARPAGPQLARPHHHGGGLRQARRSVPVAHGGNQHDDTGRNTGSSYLRRPCSIRARFDYRAHPRRHEGRTGARRQERTRSRSYPGSISTTPGS